MYKVEVDVVINSGQLENDNYCKISDNGTHKTNNPTSVRLRSDQQWAHK